MRISESCAICLYEKQSMRVPNEEYLARVKQIIDNRDKEDCSPYMVYLFDNLQKEMFGKAKSYKEVKKQYNDLVLGMEDVIRDSISASDDPLLSSFLYSRLGNYIDFGALKNVHEEEFLNLLKETEFSDGDKTTYESFINQCQNGTSFLLICDNCGEIVLDKLFLEQLSRRFPHLDITVMVRGGEVLNDATTEDAVYAGINKVARVIDNGYGIGGTIYKMLPEDTKMILNSADVILAKGQGNYESMNHTGLHVFYSFLCKCDLFVRIFNVPQFTGIFMEEIPD